MDTIVYQPTTLKNLSTLALIEQEGKDPLIWSNYLYNKCYRGIDYILLRCWPCQVEFSDLNCGANTWYVNIRVSSQRKEYGIEYAFETDVKRLARACEDSEWTCQWFILLAKMIRQYEEFPNTPSDSEKLTIEVSPHWWYALWTSGFIDKMWRRQYQHHLVKLLMLCGDIESNPGPDYKAECRAQYYRRKFSKKLEKSREEKKMDRELQKTDKIDVEMQIFGSLGPVAAAIGTAYTGMKTVKTMTKLHSFMDALFPHLDEIMQSVKRTVQSVENTVTVTCDYIGLIGDVLFELLHLVLVKPANRMFSLMISLTRMLFRYGFPMKIVSEFRDYFRSSFGNLKFVEMQISIDEVTTLSPTFVILALVGVLSLAFQGFLPQKTQMEVIVKRMGDLGKSLKGIQDFDAVFHDSVAKAMDYFRTDILGLAPIHGLEKFISGIDTWFVEVRSLLSRTGDKRSCDAILTDPKTVIEVENLYKRGLEFSREISDKRVQRELALPFQHHMKLMTDLMKQVDTTGAFGTRPRTQPVVIWLYGESGVGKSGMSWPLAVDLNNLYMPNAEEARDFSKHIYMRNVEQEFWDNYQGQNIVIYDDFGQIVDTPGQPNAEFMELIRTANIAPYPLHMAHLEDKRKTRFTSKVLLLTSNVLEQNVTSLTFPDAFRRRIDLCARVRNRPEYTKMGYSRAARDNVERLDKQKVFKETGDVISTDVYLLDLVDAESGEVLERDLSYDDFLKRAKAKANECFDSSTKMNKFLEEYAEKRFASMQIDYEFYDCEDEKPRLMSEEIMEMIGTKEEVKTRFGKFSFDNVPLYYQDKRILDFHVFFAEMLVGLAPDDQFKTDVDGVDMDEYVKRNFERTADYISRNTELRIDSKLRWLETLAQYGMRRLTETKDKLSSFMENHPWLMGIGAVTLVVQMLSWAGLWSKLFSPVSKLVDTFCKGNVEVVSYNGEKGFDLTGLTEKQIISLLPVMCQHNTTMIVCKVTPQILEIAKESNQNVRFCVMESCLEDHGKRFEVQTLVTEAKVSGDNITMKPKHKVIEARVSGDQVTMKPKQRIIEAKPSGDQITQKPQRTKFIEIDEEIPCDMQMWKDQTAQNLISSRIFSNLYKIAVIRNGEHKPLLNGLFVRANLMLVPGHLLQFLEEDDEIELLNTFEVRFQLPFKDVKVIPITDSFGDSKEAALLSFPRYVSSHSDLVKHFQTGETMAMYKRADVCLPVLRYCQKNAKLLMNILGYHECEALDKPVTLVDSAKGEFMLRQGLEYRCATTAGDCGAPVILNETQVLRKIAGIHVAGARDGYAYAESVTQKDLERAFSKIDAQMQIMCDLDCICIPCEVTAPAMKFLPIGRSKHKLFEPNKTDLIPSLMHGVVKPCTTKPAHLFDRYVNIKHKNLAKCAMDTPYIDKALVDRAYVYVRSKWLRGAEARLQRVFTLDEVVRGSDVSEYIGPINRTSSPGYPWILEKKKGTKGKQGWFGSDEYYIDDTVRADCERRIADARKGIRTPTIWVDTLKDERRPIKKVDDLKTRVFSNGPMDFNLVFRQYFIGFIAHLMENRIQNEVAIGTNVYSQDWKKIFMKLTSKGRKVIAGDFSTFDGTLNVCLMDKFVDLPNEFYDDGPENALIRRVLMQDVYNSVHMCDDVVYMMTHSQPSGNPATTPLNCFINSIGVRICYEICARWAATKNHPHSVKHSMNNFDKHVSLVSYGDDNVINFSDVVAPWFNMDTITTAFAELGFVYTDETKSGKIELWRDISEVAFLKRKFRQVGTVVEAPLDLDTTLEMISWTRGNLDHVEATKINCETSIMELSMHDKDIFDLYSTEIEKEFRRRTGKTLETDTYKGYFDERYLKYYA